VGGLEKNGMMAMVWQEAEIEQTCYEIKRLTQHLTQLVLE